MSLRTLLVMAAIAVPATTFAAPEPAAPVPGAGIAANPAMTASSPQANGSETLRAQIGKAIKSPKTSLNSAALRAFRLETERMKSGDDALLLGWLDFKRKNWNAAITWFERAKAWGREEQADEGLVWSMNGAGRIAEAENFAYARRAKGKFGQIYVDLVSMQLSGAKMRIPPRQRLARFEQNVQETRSAAGAEALAWHHFKRRAYSRAKPWFERSIAWSPNESRVLGLAYTHQKLGQMRALRELAAHWGKRYPAVATLERQLRQTADQARTSKEASVLYDRAVADFKAGRYKEAMAELDAHERLLPGNEAAGLMRGWTLYRLQRYREAEDLFTQLNRQHATSEAQHGMYYSCAAYTPEQFCPRSEPKARPTAASPASLR